MSVQTHKAVPEAPASTRFVDKARFRWDKILTDPNPIWMRELRQSARLTRTPFILMALTIIATLIIAGIGGSVNQSARSDTVGQALYHSFFSLAFFIVAWAGPALAANAIASEREGRTWEAVILTGMDPKIIARGKFLGAFTAIASYVVMLAPVGALSFLFGGVDWLEVIFAFLYLFVIALLSVAFGLAVSSKMTSARGAIVVTLLLSLPVSGTVFGIFGPGLGFAAHKLWERVPEGAPVWLPVAYVRGEFGVEYVLILFVVPILLIALPAWFLYESTIANLTEPTDDRSSGLKRWFLVSSLVLTLACAFALVPLKTGKDLFVVVLLELCAIAMFALFSTAVFIGEPLDASRRVRFRWDVAKVGKLRRKLGPGLERTFLLVTASVLLSFAVVLGAALFREQWLVRPAPTNELESLARFSFYVISFILFCIGLAVWLRPRSTNLFAARLIFAVIIGGLAIVPWIGAAIAGVTFQSETAALAVASPSPFFAAVLLDTTPKPEVVIAGLGMGMAWVAFGALLFGLGVGRTRKIVRSHEERLAQADAQLAAEDEAARTQLDPAEPAFEPEPPPPAQGGEPER